MTQHDTASANALLQALRQFTGTEHYYYTPLFRNFRYTDGVRFLANEAGAYWLIEAILSHQGNPTIRDNPDIEDFQVWHLAVREDKTAELQVGDGNGDVITMQTLEYTDFPMSDIILFLQNRVLMLPNEY